MADLPLHYYKRLKKDVDILLTEVRAYLQEKDSTGNINVIKFSTRIEEMKNKCNIGIGELKIAISTLYTELKEKEYLKMKSELESAIEELDTYISDRIK